MKSILTFLLVSSFCLSCLQPAYGKDQYNLVVAKDGSGNFTTIQAAIDAAPSGRTTPFRILVKNGKYKEQVRIPAGKPFIYLIGENVTSTVITYNAAAKDSLPGGRTVGTPNSATFFVYAADFFAMNITFENSYGDGSQAVAASVYGDRSAFVHCRFLGNQDTLLTYQMGSSPSRQYYSNCYIDGNVDFIFGNAIVIFDSCIIYAKTRTRAGNSFITAANTPAGQQYGYVFRNCILPANNGSTSYFLGRPWQNSAVIVTRPKSHTKVIFINSVMSNTIRPEAWTVWDSATVPSLIYYAEYHSRYFNKALLDISKRVDWSYQMNREEAARYTIANVFAEWDPIRVINSIGDVKKEIAISNFINRPDLPGPAFSWNLSWPVSNTRFELFASTDSLQNFHKVNEVTSTSDTIFNYMIRNELRSSANERYYYLKASNKGYADAKTDTVMISHSSMK